LSEIGNRTCESQHHRIAALNLLAAIFINWNVSGASSSLSGARFSCKADQRRRDWPVGMKWYWCRSALNVC
jgi:3-deoxy-D-arabino-heptulosonate 7-phosphate (DAHP) synthase